MYSQSNCQPTLFDSHTLDNQGRINNPKLLTSNIDEALEILKDWKDLESNLDDNLPILIGSRAAKYHLPSFRETNDWDLVVTVSQTIELLSSFIIGSIGSFQMLFYKGIGVKIHGYYKSSKKNSFTFDLDLVTNGQETIKNDVGSIVELLDIPIVTSSKLIMDMCREDDDITTIPPFGLKCRVASLEVLEALKTSHIFLPANFSKNISDLHTLRKVLQYAQRIPGTRSLFEPARDQSVANMLKIRTKETEIISEIHGQNFNRNKINDDNFSPRLAVTHDELYELVKYGEQSILKTMRNDLNSRIDKSLFDNADYFTQLKCVKEEAMTIALERYIVPRSCVDSEKAFCLALSHICTASIDAWFGKFAVDNYPRLLGCDKDLTQIAKDIRNKRKLKKATDDISILSQHFPDSDSFSIVEKLIQQTQEFNPPDLILPEPDDTNVQFETFRYGLRISPPNGKGNNEQKRGLECVITVVYKMQEENENKINEAWWASVSVYPFKVESDDSESVDQSISDTDTPNGTDPTTNHPFDYDMINDDVEIVELEQKHILLIYSDHGGAGLSGFGDVESDSDMSPWVLTKPADQVASELGIPELNGDFLVRYIIAYLDPELPNGGDYPFRKAITTLEHKKEINMMPKQHLWFYLWWYATYFKGGDWDIF
ncbi:7206_t:CDS:2 [Acaulospora morrowiae]|uniref:7206_t:CDS:1 n=1 Tax=Acaulospora morrowiae TaxID=94023 RepID=A0A9N9H4E7_9GLOM|nr:7206_t:CDS:2 [Acaulospora morrowiae]